MPILDIDYGFTHLMAEMIALGTVRGKRSEANNPQGKASLEEDSLKIGEVYCLPDEASWSELQQQYQQFDRSLCAIAVQLDQMSSYLAQWNDLTSVVDRAIDQQVQWKAFLEQLGTYQAAERDRRYKVKLRSLFG